jgi:hypothetical protein
MMALGMMKMLTKPQGSTAQAAAPEVLLLPLLQLLPLLLLLPPLMAAIAACSSSCLMCPWCVVSSVEPSTLPA